MKKPTSITRRNDKRLRWAKNICTKWEKASLAKTSSLYTVEDWRVQNAINEQRYERAVALIVAHKLSQ